MSQFFLRTNKTEGKAPLYVRTRRKGILFCVTTGIMVDVKEWAKAQKSLPAMQRYERTEEGMRVHDLQLKIMKAIDALYAEDKVNSKEDKAILEHALSSVVNGTVEEIQQTVKVASAKTKAMVIGFYDYFFAGISDGSIRHGKYGSPSAGICVTTAKRTFLLMTLTSPLLISSRCISRRRASWLIPLIRMSPVSVNSAILPLWRVITRTPFL